MIAVQEIDLIKCTCMSYVWRKLLIILVHGIKVRLRSQGKVFDNLRGALKYIGVYLHEQKTLEKGSFLAVDCITHVFCLWI